MVGVPTGPDDAAARTATDAVVAAVAPWTGGGLLNLQGPAAPERVGRLWDDATRARLLRIRDRVDPACLFAANTVLG